MLQLNEYGEVRPSNKLLMMRLICVEVIILFGSLLFAVGFLSKGLPADAPRTAKVSFVVSTIALVLSSLAIAPCTRVWLAPATVKRLVFTALILGVVFMVGQVVGFADLLQFFAQQPRGTAGPGLSMLLVVIVVHGLHTVAGVALLSRLVVRVVLRPEEDRRYSLRILEPYWHLLTVVWGVFYALL
jgi:heme/copper-type cytochrome/quinol oxidase subunit 3